jgi:hypothetical protein
MLRERIIIMNRFLLSCLFTVALAVPAMASEPAKQPEASKPEHKDGKDSHSMNKEEKMAAAAKECQAEIAKAEERLKAMAEGEGKDMAAYFIEHAKIEEKALGNKNMLGHWWRHKANCHRYLKKSERKVYGKKGKHGKAESHKEDKKDKK